MPTYEYACDACEYTFEREQRITEKPIRKCPNCGKLKARRMINGGNFILKGGNWEKDLYSGASNKKTSDSAGDETAKSEKSTESKSADSKSEKSSSSKSDKKSSSDKKAKGKSTSKS